MAPITFNWRVLVALALTLAAGFLGGTFRGSLVSPSAAKSLMQAEPYTAVFAEFVSFGGKSNVASLTTFAKRSDGSTVSRLGTATRGGRTLLFASGLRVITDDSLRRKSSQPVTLAPERRSLSERCANEAAGERFVGEEQIEGLRSGKVTKSGSDRERTDWRALDLECVSLGSQIDYPNGERSKTELVAFVRGEPDPGLFDVPNDYSEGPPSSLAPPGLVRSEQMKKRDEALDKKYFEQRSHK